MYHYSKLLLLLLNISFEQFFQLTCNTLAQEVSEAEPASCLQLAALTVFTGDCVQAALTGLAVAAVV